MGGVHVQNLVLRLVPGLWVRWSAQRILGSRLRVSGLFEVFGSDHGQLVIVFYVVLPGSWLQLIDLRRTPRPVKVVLLGIQEDPNMILILLYSHYHNPKP